MKKPKVKKKSILDSAKPVTELDEGISAIFYGRSGTGKTALSGTFPKPLLLLDFGEKGTDTLAQEKGVDVIRVEDWDTFTDIYWELKDGEHNYKTVVIDALPGVQQLAISEAKRRARKSDEDQSSQRDMGEATKLMGIWLYNYRDLKELGIDIAMNAHDRIRESDTDGDDHISPEVGPNLMPGITKSLMGAVDVIGVTFIRVTKEKKKLGIDSKRTVEYCLRVGPHEIYNTKIRVPRGCEIPELIVDPTYDKIKAVIKGAKPTPKMGTKRLVKKPKLKGAK